MYHGIKAITNKHENMNKKENNSKLTKYKEIQNYANPNIKPNEPKAKLWLCTNLVYATMYVLRQHIGKSSLYWTIMYQGMCAASLVSNCCNLIRKIKSALYSVNVRRLKWYSTLQSRIFVYVSRCDDPHSYSCIPSTLYAFICIFPGVITSTGALHCIFSAFCCAEMLGTL